MHEKRKEFANNKIDIYVVRKVKNYLIETGLYDETEDTNYQKVMLDLGIKLDTTFAQFNLYTNAVTFKGRSYELYNVCWFKIYSDDLDYGIESAHKVLKLPDEYIPLYCCPVKLKRA